MSAVSTSLQKEAESIFTDLGYEVTPEGAEMQAQRKWRVVQVTPMAEPAEPPSSGELRCFVTHADTVSALEERLELADPEYEWAIIGVEDDGYSVCRS
ncbi:hypothetical protein GRX03_07275 [Halovenus sp. WSH3]|uniref:Uncharacterized protein n=1 Tax=Halovenus carboxidivorans TaxID=2692199 RepID=A0A6B0T749_9EURY|nr:hypothetical protein [Halovenus carboxidivorans]MXR51403.1 hypothetical protein [Halovenus carboxidivorans]